MQTTRKCTWRGDRTRLSKTGRFALKQSLGERYATYFGLAWFLDFATRCGVESWVAPSTDCV
jgi:hypothetical protein